MLVSREPSKRLVLGFDTTPQQTQSMDAALGISRRVEAQILRAWQSAEFGKA
ncbi:hypothetical protein [Microbulbifer sp. THAF38]|uniref:hypothetical protein n=1 Tax=Microbulbifer sp. THAF38 TaxID=2587856 RepID=UPI0012A7FCEA|nr:hypothetical protein [Microbulbifer sp. THAF38]QFT55235.1 hypothetical protein FIU95_11775 [Microbulbifer sp. THAF38]